RILVLVGCLPLMPRNAGVLTVRAQNQTCTNFGPATKENCPSGCTSPTYTDYPLLGGSGWTDATQNTTPCSPSTCLQPGGVYNAPTPSVCKNPPCCLATGKTCGTLECHNNDPCCGEANCNPSTLKCCKADGLDCSGPVDCCNTPCISDVCQNCVGLGYGCNMEAPNCCTPGAQCQNSTCCLPVGMRGCGSGAPCCPGYVCQNGTCACPMGGPAAPAFLRALWR